MHKISFLTLFPEIYSGWKNSSIIKKAQEKKCVEIEIHDFREYANDKRKSADDYPFGGGGGMVIKIDPIVDCLEKKLLLNTYRILLSPKAKPLNQKKINDLSEHPHVTLIAGHYEGIDERIQHYIDDTVSIGNYVTSGGELPSMILADALIRLYPGVLSPERVINESHQNEFVDYPIYTKPVNFRGWKVPEILLSGNHLKIAEWRKKKQQEKTMEINKGKQKNN